MKRIPPPVPIPAPPAPPPGLADDVVASGLPVHPEDRIKLFSPSQWELFVQEWVDSLRGEYEFVERCGGAGDMGRDVIATVKGGKGAWDNWIAWPLSTGKRGWVLDVRRILSRTIDGSSSY